MIDDPASPSSVRPNRLRAVAQSLASIGEPLTVVVFAEDAHNRICKDYQGLLTISCNVDGVLEDLDFQMRPIDTRGALERNEFRVAFDQPGVYYLHVSDDKRGFETVSNPIVIDDEALAERLYWGATHAYTGGEQEDIYRNAYARGLDYVAVADQHFAASCDDLELRLEAQCDLVEQFELPGTFATLCASKTPHHLNLYFREADSDNMKDLLDQLAAATCPENPPDKRFWSVLTQPQYAKDVLAVCHQSMRTAAEFCQTQQRLIETDSTFAGSPCNMKGHVREALDAGLKLGFVGGPAKQSGVTITGIYARELSPSNVFDAMYDRSCFVTSAHRTIIDICANGEAMGRSLSGIDELDFSGIVAGDGEVEQVQLISNGAIIQSVTGNGSKMLGIAWTLPRPAPGYYYFRVFLCNGNAAWTSPVWVE